MLEDVGFYTTTTWEPADLARVTQVALFDGIMQRDRAPQMDAEMMPTNSVESTPRVLSHGHTASYSQNRKESALIPRSSTVMIRLLPSWVDAAATDEPVRRWRRQSRQDSNAPELGAH